VVSGSVIIGSYVCSSSWDKIWDGFGAMQRAGVLPIVSVIVMAIQACGALGSLCSWEADAHDRNCPWI
jgi:hypothetical protein